MIRVPRRRLRSAAASPCRSSTLATTSAAVVRRSLCIAEFSRAPKSGVWYFHVDIAVFTSNSSSSSSSSMGSSESLSGDESDDSGYASPRCSLERVVQRYSVRRRYSDFLDLYGRVKQFLTTATSNNNDSANIANALPPFPSKELISPYVFGPLYRLSSPRHVLEDRRSKFETLLQFIEQHAVARRCAAFEHFLGQPPQLQDGGYVSLKEYTSQNWFASLKLLTRAKHEQRERHYTMDTEALVLLIDGPGTNNAQDVLGKRRRRVRLGSNTSSSVSSSTLLETTYEVLPVQAPSTHQQQFQTESPTEQLPTSTPPARRDNARVEGVRPRLKKSKSFHHSQIETANWIAAPSR